MLHVMLLKVAHKLVCCCCLQWCSCLFFYYLFDFVFSAEMPLDALMKQYAGAYADDFEWPQPSSHSDKDDMEETEGAFAIKNQRACPT